MRPFRGPIFRGARFSRKAEISRFGAICGGLSTSRDLMSALARRAKQGRLSRFRYFPEARVFNLPLFPLLAANDQSPCWRPHRKNRVSEDGAQPLLCVCSGQVRGRTV